MYLLHDNNFLDNNATDGFIFSQPENNVDRNELFIPFIYHVIVKRTGIERIKLSQISNLRLWTTTMIMR